MPGADPIGSPPSLAEALVLRGLPDEVAEAIAGDLREEHARRLAESGRLRADLWYWGQALLLRRGALRRAARRLRAVRPTWERNRPRKTGDREPDAWSTLGMIFRDLKYALRRLLKSPGFTLIAILSLALGIGANTAMFSVVNAVLIRSLPVEEPERVVELYTSEDDGFAYSTTSYPDFADLRAGNEVFTDVIATQTFLARVERGQETLVAFGQLITWDYFQALGVQMALGRSFLPEEDETPGSHPVTILGYRTWANDFGSDPGIVGKSVRLNGRPYTVVGVAPEEFTGTMPVLVTGFYVPMMMANELMGGAGEVDRLARRSTRSLFVKARLRPGVTVTQADAAVEAFSRGLAEQYPESNAERIMSVVPAEDVSLHPVVDGGLKPVAALLLGVVGLVLLIACANLASFLLARAEDRRKEIAVRLALGAGRATLVRQLLVETTLLALLGGAVGIVLADWTVGLLMSFRPPLPVPVDIDISLDRTVFLFTAGVSLVAGMLFGLVPALQATNPDVAPTLKDESTGGSRSRFSLRRVLVVTQVALSFVLLIGAGLFVRSLQKAQAIDPGFYTGSAALVWPMPDMSGYETTEEQKLVLETLEERLLAHPLIDMVAQADRMPLGSSFQTNRYVLPGVPSEKPYGDHDIDNATVSPAYFETMEVDIVRGRGFTEDDVEGDRVAIVSEAFQRTYYPGEDVLGMRLARPRGGEEIRVVGVARDTKVRTLGEAPRPYVYEPVREDLALGMQFVVRGDAPAPELLAAARRVVDEVDPDLVLFEAKTMNEHLALMLFPPRMAALLLSVFGGLALLLSAIGIYGVVSYAVARRTRELGIRMSLGASAGDVVRMAVGGGMKLVVVGGAVGVLLAAGVTWSISRFLYGIGTTDVVTFAVIPVLLCGVALVAAFVPARRASRVDPVRALRSE